ncbi:hypothetical protein B1R27_24355, partial [Streptomyces sp. GKU 895]
ETTTEHYLGQFSPTYFDKDGKSTIANAARGGEGAEREGGAGRGGRGERDRGGEAAGVEDGELEEQEEERDGGCGPWTAVHRCPLPVCARCACAALGYT